MSVTIKMKLLNLMALKSKAHSKGIQDRLGEQVQNDMFPFVPKAQTKNLSKGRYNRNTEAVVYRTPYARAQFYGFVNGVRVRKYTTPGTSRRWDLRAKARYAKQWKQQVIKAYRL